jgi:hypothetical protein
MISSFLYASGIGTPRAEVVTSCASLLNDPNLPNYARRAVSDNPALDEAVLRELQKILTIIPVNPAFHYIEENPPGNSFAMPTSDVLGTKGTVLLGLRLLNSLLDVDDGGGAIAGICAHECGHIYQYFSDWYNRLSPAGTIAVELHADLIAGYYMGKRGDTDHQRVMSFSWALFSRAGFDYTDPNFHGDPGDRAAAVMKGYMWANQNVGLAETCARGANYIKNLIGEQPPAR